MPESMPFPVLSPVSPRSLPVLAAALSAVLGLVPTANAIVYRNDVSDATAKALSNQNQFGATGQTPGASGTLIARDWVLTARHVTGGTANGTTTSSFAIGGVTYTGTVYADPNTDVSLIHLTGNLPPVSIQPIAPAFVGGEAGKLVWLAGYGGHGPVSQSANGGANLTYNGQLYAGTNIVREYSNPYLYFNNNNTDPTSTAFEVSTAPGDSGGPMYQQINNRWYVIGEVFGAGQNGFIHSPTNRNSSFILNTVRAVSGNPNYTFATQAAPTSLVWDGNVLVDGISDGGGFWNAERTNFIGTATGFNYQWENAMKNDVTFGNASGAAGVVTITNTNLPGGTKIDGTAAPAFTATGATAHHVTFNAAGSGTYTIDSSGNAPLTLADTAAGDPTITANADATISAPIAGTSATITKAGLAKLTLSGVNSYAGNLLVTAGTVQARTAAALPGYATSGRVAVNSGTTLALDVGGLAASWTETQINALRASGAFAPGSSLGLDTTAAAFTYGGSLSGNIGLVKLGTNTLTLNATNLHTGGTRVLAGTLQAATATALPNTGPVAVSSGGTLELKAPNATFAAPLTLAGSGAAGSRGALYFNHGGNGTTTLTGGIALAGNATIGSFAVNNTVNFNAPITGTGNLSFNVEGGDGANQSHTATANFNAASTYAGNTDLGSGNGNRGFYNIGVNNALPVGTVVTLAPNAGSATLNLNGRSQRVAGLTNTGAAANAIVSGPVGALSTLEINNAAAFAFSGKVTGSLAITKTGIGTQTFSGTNDYNGLTTVDGGSLRLRPAAFDPVLNRGGADLKNGTLVFDYAGGTSPLSTVRSLLATSYASGFTAGQFESSTATPNVRGLGYGDDGTAVTVLATLYGDANLDLTVNFNDFLLLQSNFLKPDTTFGQGNFNYDNVTNFNDFLLLQSNFGKSLNGNAFFATEAQMASLTAFGESVGVPEPTALAVLAAAGALALRRRRVVG